MLRGVLRATSAGWVEATRGGARVPERGAQSALVDVAKFDRIHRIEISPTPPIR